MVEYSGEKVTLMACSKCNIKCEHCYISYKGDLTPDQLKERALNLIKKYKVEINGAEILTDLGYLESYPVVGQDFLMTNGLVINNNPEIIDTLKFYGIKKIFMSYHFGIQDEISSVSVKRLQENINYIKAKGLKIRLYTTITSSNYKMVHEIVEKCKEFGAYSVRFTNYINQGNALNMDISNALDDTKIKIFFKQLSEERNINDIDKFKITRCGSFGKVDSKNFRCYAGKNNVVLTPDGQIYPCIFIAKPGFEIGKYDGDKILLNDFVNNDEQDCIVKKICNEKDEKIFKKVFGGVL